MPIVLYHFRYLDPLTGKWVKSRYAARVEMIAARHERYELIEPPELREEVDPTKLTAGHLASPSREP